MTLTLYHGSPQKDFTPTFGLGKDEHDYGRGFYTTDDIELGREWAAGQRAGESARENFQGSCLWLRWDIHTIAAT